MRYRIALMTSIMMSLLTSNSFAQTASDCAPIDVSSPAAMQAHIEAHGGAEFTNPISVRPTSETAKHDIVVHYATNRIAGCNTTLRSYNGKLVGETIRARPGDTIHLRLVNALPIVPDGAHRHPQRPAPAGHGDHFSFNITNLHTHGLHTAPQGAVEPGESIVKFESDNVLVMLQPGQQQEYRIHIHDKHPTGTFWYHAHVHGSTATQLASGMSGALIIEDGTATNGDLDTIPEIAATRPTEKIFVLQQLAYDRFGVINGMPSVRRPTMINGQLVPVIRLRPGEVQRWRFIHAGTQENIAIALDGHPLNEIATDGITIGRMVSWPETAIADGNDKSKLFLAPGYRTDVLVKAELQPGETRRRIFLRDLKLPNSISLRAQEARFARLALEALPTISGIPIDLADKPEQVLAEVIIEGDPLPMALPGKASLANLVPEELKHIADNELQPVHAQSVSLKVASGLVCHSDGTCSPCSQTNPPPECNFPRFLVDERQFSDSIIRTLKLGAVAEWTLVTGMDGPNLVQRHPFHIHVNPFAYQREEPGSAGHRHWVWKDTILVPPPDAAGSQIKLRTRYTRFTGRFVLHCHILTHEDRGMMQLVEIAP